LIASLRKYDGRAIADARPCGSAEIALKIIFKEVPRVCADTVVIVILFASGGRIDRCVFEKEARSDELNKTGLDRSQFESVIKFIRDGQGSVKKLYVW
jgi:hypothetical protein